MEEEDETLILRISLQSHKKVKIKKFQSDKFKF